MAEVFKITINREGYKKAYRITEIDLNAIKDFLQVPANEYIELLTNLSVDYWGPPEEKSKASMIKHGPNTIIRLAKEVDLLRKWYKILTERQY
ncbi:hypothetical protein [Chitinophaga sp. LS1]|uniref:hypothetical protein n=1 Tax=Chitinophaga sp. LS1 TaxID=3051176 RepID=UPI002AABB3A9|nr:hypothetical protein [Chitinophaga sp. LS1]WPV67545.1 hypothetical protein QQL36_02250 [Chitinophaga sp. LS1]